MLALSCTVWLCTNQSDIDHFSGFACIDHACVAFGVLCRCTQRAPKAISIWTRQDQTVRFVSRPKILGSTFALTSRRFPCDVDRRAYPARLHVPDEVHEERALFEWPYVECSLEAGVRCRLARLFTSNTRDVRVRDRILCVAGESPEAIPPNYRT
jgi:hypothetical protein